MTPSADFVASPRILTIPARDGTPLRAALYAPAGDGSVPAVFAAPPHRFDGNRLSPSPRFLNTDTPHFAPGIDSALVLPVFTGSLAA